MVLAFTLRSNTRSDESARKNRRPRDAPKHRWLDGIHSAAVARVSRVGFTALARKGGQQVFRLSKWWAWSRRRLRRRRSVNNYIAEVVEINALSMTIR